MRVLLGVLVVCSALLASATAVATHAADASTPPGSQAVQQTLCPWEQRAGIAADFGHRRTKAAAHLLLAKAERQGFKGLVVQRRGCKDFAVVLTGLKDLRQGRAFRREALKSGFHVTLECRSRPFVGGLVAVFGHRRTRRLALKLRARAAAVGFKSLQIVQDQCNDWEVDLYGLKTPKQRKDFQAEARRAGFRVTFEPG